MKIPVIYTCRPTKGNIEIAEMLDCHTAKQLLKQENVTWTATLQVLEGEKIEITFSVEAVGVSEEETVTELIDPKTIVSIKGKKTLVGKLKQFITDEEDLSLHIDLLEKIFKNTLHIEMVEMSVPNGDAVARFEVDIDVVPTFRPSFDIIC